MAKKYSPTPQLEKLRQLVEQAGGNKAFAEKYSCLADDPINPVYIGQLLNGDRSFRDRGRENMARRAGLPADYFEVKEPDPTPYLQPATPPIQKQVQELIDLLQNADDELKSQILGAAKMLVAQDRIQKQKSRERTGS